MSVNPDTFTFTQVNLMILEFLPTTGESEWLSNYVADASTVLEDCDTATRCSRWEENSFGIAYPVSTLMPSL